MMLPRVTRDPVMLQTLDMRQGVRAIDPIARVMKKRERKVLSRPTMVKRFFTRSTGILPVGPVGILPADCSRAVINGQDARFAPQARCLCYRNLSELNRMPPLWSKILLPSTYNESKRQPQITDWNHRRGRDRKTTASARFQTPIRSGNRRDFKLHLRKRGKVLPGKCSDRCAHR